ncbi:Glutamate-gated chloride channel [Nymphon striatum]|nr:Glutamate-gated chloride channel [Nymphon striatum]
MSVVRIQRQIKLDNKMAFKIVYIQTMSYDQLAPPICEHHVYIRQRWRDPRLENRNMASYIDLSDTKLIKKIWKPDLYFPNAKSGWFQIVTVPNFLLRLYPSGEILYMLRLRLTFSCMMNLNRYPLDHQICPIELASCNATSHTMADPQSIVRLNKLKELLLKRAEVDHKMALMNTSTSSMHLCEYSCLRAELHLKRSIGFYLVQKYFPTMLIVFISWISFWLDVNAIPARVTVGVTTLLTITSESSDSQTKLAPVSYVKALDVWMGVCTTFVFAALIEFTIVNYLARKPFPSRPNVKVKFQNILLISSSNCEIIVQQAVNSITSKEARVSWRATAVQFEPTACLFRLDNSGFVSIVTQECRLSSNSLHRLVKHDVPRR